MGLNLVKTNGLFAQAVDGKLLFLATPTSRSAYVVPDHQHEDALLTLSKYWGFCELFSIATIAPVALHFGALVLLAAFAIFMIASGIAYRLALRSMVSGLESVLREPIAEENHMVRLRNLLRTAADGIHPGFLWLCEAASIVTFISSGAIVIINGHRMDHFIGGSLGIAFFGGATIVGACMISMKHCNPVGGTSSFAARQAMTGS